MGIETLLLPAADVIIGGAAVHRLLSLPIEIFRLYKYAMTWRDSRERMVFFVDLARLTRANGFFVDV